MINAFRAAATVLVVLLIWSGVTFSAARQMRAVDLPGAVVAFAFLMSHSSTFARSIGSEHPVQDESELIQNMRRIRVSLDSLQADVALRLSFQHLVAIVQSERPGQSASFSQPEGGLLFVSTPLPSRPGMILVVLSSKSPERTTAFLLDEDYTTELLYDSFEKGAITNEENTVIGQVTEIRVEGNGEFLVKEDLEPGSRGDLVGRAERIFRLNTLNRIVSLEKH